MSKLINEYKRFIRRIAKKAGVIDPYDFYDFKTKRASKKEIERDIARYNELNTDFRFPLESKNNHIVNFLKYSKNEHGIHYIPTYVRDLWGAKKVYENKPRAHYDCGSSFEHFISALIPMGIELRLVDIRDLRDRFNTSLFSKLDSKLIDTGGGGGSILK